MTTPSKPIEAGHAVADEAVDITIDEVTGGALGKKGIGWAIFEWARNPYYNLIVIAIFAPYFATHVVGDPVKGQALAGRVIFFAGLIMVVLAPILGSVIDKAGRKKPFIVLVLGLLGLCAAGLWFVAPDNPAAIPLGVGLLVTAYCCYTVSELLHNSMLPGAGAPKSVPMISGLGLALGNLAALLLSVTIFVVADGELFGLDDVMVGRLVGPLCAVWLALFIIPFFVFMPDVFRAGQTWKDALSKLARLTDQERSAAGGIWPVGFLVTKPFLSIRKKVREFPNVMMYLFARMIWSDALAVTFAIGSVYVSGVLGWSLAELALNSVIVGTFAVLGGFLGGVLDQRLGPKRALTLELSMMIVIFIGQLSITSDSLFYGLIPNVNLHDGSVFNTLSDIVYIGLTMIGALMIVACISSSRYMLVHIAPPKRIGEFFGFYAMVGSVTVWLGPGLVDIATTLSGSQRIGMTPIAGLFLLGLILLQFVKADKTPAYAQ